MHQALTSSSRHAEAARKDGFLTLRAAAYQVDAPARAQVAARATQQVARTMSCSARHSRSTYPRGRTRAGAHGVCVFESSGDRLGSLDAAPPLMQPLALELWAPLPHSLAHAGVRRQHPAWPTLLAALLGRDELGRDQVTQTLLPRLRLPLSLSNLVECLRPMRRVRPQDAARLPLHMEDAVDLERVLC
jgi:hypothetical protein